MAAGCRPWGSDNLGGIVGPSTWNYAGRQGIRIRKGHGQHAGPQDSASAGPFPVQSATATGLRGYCGPAPPVVSAWQSTTPQFDELLPQRPARSPRAGALGLKDGDRARVRSLTGAIELDVAVTDSPRAGIVVVEHGWGSRPFDPSGEALPDRQGANRNLLTGLDEEDPLSQMSAFNETWVAVEPVTDSWFFERTQHGLSVGQPLQRGASPFQIVLAVATHVTHVRDFDGQTTCAAGGLSGTALSLRQPGWNAAFTLSTALEVLTWNRHRTFR